MQVDVRTFKEENEARKNTVLFQVSEQASQTDFIGKTQISEHFIGDRVQKFGNIQCDPKTFAKTVNSS